MLHRFIKPIAAMAALFVAFASLAAPPGVMRTNVNLAWDYPTNELSTNLTFKLYSATNIASPVATWPLLTTVVGTNLSVTLPIDAQQRYFVMTASNWWGESIPSNVAGTPPLPRSDSKLSLGP